MSFAVLLTIEVFFYQWEVFLFNFIVRLWQSSFSEFQIIVPGIKLLFCHLFTSSHIFSLRELLANGNNFCQKISIIGVVMFFCLSLDLSKLNLKSFRLCIYRGNLEIREFYSCGILWALQFLVELIEGLLSPMHDLLLQFRPHIY